MNQVPVPQQSNNGILNVTHASPMKDITSDNDSTFGLNRTLFQKSYQPAVNFMQFQTSYAKIQRRSPAIRHGFVLDGPKSVGQKKWIGGNRDASDIVNRRRMNTTGASMNVTGPQSFKNSENNSRIDALARVRGSGYRVPPKVTNRPVCTPLYPTYYRIVSAGNNATNTTAKTVKVSSSTAYGVSPGFYSYTLANLSGTALANLAGNTFNRSYNVLTIDRKTGETTFNNYDIFGYSVENAMITQLNSLPSSFIVIISTYDEPRNNNGSPLSQEFVDAMKNCGASASFGSATGTYSPRSYTGIIQYRGSYVLVGIPGIGVGNGIERYVGVLNGTTGDPNAYVDLRISVANGQYAYISG
jgi:hypothetical protein